MVQEKGHEASKLGSGISCMEKGLFQKPLLQKVFLTQNRAQKGKRAIRPRHDLGMGCYFRIAEKLGIVGRASEFSIEEL